MLYIACNIDNLKARCSLVIPIVSFNCQHTPIREHRAGDLRHGALKAFPMVISVSRLDRGLTESSRDTKDSQNYSQSQLSCRSLDIVQFWASIHRFLRQMRWEGGRPWTSEYFAARLEARSDSGEVFSIFWIVWIFQIKKHKTEGVARISESTVDDYRVGCSTYNFRCWIHTK